MMIFPLLVLKSSYLVTNVMFLDIELVTNEYY
jgi:hypothetical protein